MEPFCRQISKVSRAQGIDDWEELQIRRRAFGILYTSWCEPALRFWSGLLYREFLLDAPVNGLAMLFPRMKASVLLFLLLSQAPVFLAIGADSSPVEYITDLAQPRKGMPIVLKERTDVISTKATFKPPVEILIEAKTEGTDLRIGYAADQVIFNWEDMQNQLRVDGGPANGQHKANAGLIPANKYVLIKWVVTPGRQSIYVDNVLRFEHDGDYSKLNNPISVFRLASKVSVKSIKVAQLPATAR